MIGSRSSEQVQEGGLGGLGGDERRDWVEEGQGASGEDRR